MPIGVLRVSCWEFDVTAGLHLFLRPSQNGNLQDEVGDCWDKKKTNGLKQFENDGHDRGNGDEGNKGMWYWGRMDVPWMDIIRGSCPRYHPVAKQHALCLCSSAGGKIRKAIVIPFGQRGKCQTWR